MYLFVKAFAYIIYSLAVYIFAYYLAASYSFGYYKDWLFDHFHEDNYDFIVVGAGSAGSIIAAELSKGKNNVLLVEAGSKPAYFSDIPIFAPLLQRSPYDWQYKTVAQKNACKGLQNNQSLWPQGKVLGGSGRLNYMAYVPGHPRDYESWFPEYTEHELNDENPIINEPRWHTHLSDMIIEAVREISPNTENDFRRIRLTMENGERWSTDRLLESGKQKNLRILTHGLVNKIIFEGNIARGIEFIRWGNKYEAFARKGVIVCAGAIGSPKLLMLSGIGPKKHLEELGIHVINDLPVGENLVDHILTGVDLVTLNVSSPLSVEILLNPISALNYSIFRQGPWTSGGIEASGTFHIGSQSSVNEAPALQLMIIPVGISQDAGFVLRKSMGISDEIFDRYFGPLMYQTAITIAPVLLHPKSSGQVKLASSNPLVDPLIDPAYLSHEDDVATLISGIRLVERLLDTEAMKKIGASLYEMKFPGCENFIFDSTKYWDCYVRHLTLTSYHPAGTCRIGSVVDKLFGVLNMKNLWIVDASVLPELPSGNINASVMMLARRALGYFNEKRDKRKAKKANTCARFFGYLTALYGPEYEIFYSQTCPIFV